MFKAVQGLCGRIRYKHADEITFEEYRKKFGIVAIDVEEEEETKVKAKTDEGEEAGKEKYFEELAKKIKEEIIREIAETVGRRREEEAEDLLESID